MWVTEHWHRLSRDSVESPSKAAWPWAGAPCSGCKIDQENPSSFSHLVSLRKETEAESLSTMHHPSAPVGLQFRPVPPFLRTHTGDLQAAEPTNMPAFAPSPNNPPKFPQSLCCKWQGHCCRDEISKLLHIRLWAAPAAKQLPEQGAQVKADRRDSVPGSHKQGVPSSTSHRGCSTSALLHCRCSPRYSTLHTQTQGGPDALLTLPNPLGKCQIKSLLH